MTSNKSPVMDRILPVIVGVPVIAWVSYLTNGLGERSATMAWCLIALTAVAGPVALNRYRIVRRILRDGIPVEAHVTRVIGNPEGFKHVWLRYEVQGQQIDTRLTLSGVRIGQHVRILVDPMDRTKCMPVE
jgi:hypothetical protein